MKYRVLLSLLVVSAFAGCLATMPPAVKDVYLVEKTADEEKKLNTIEDEIIAINQENNKLKDAIKITKQMIVVSENQVASLEEQKKVKIEKEKLYTISNENDKLAEVKKQIQENDEKLRLENINLKYLKAKKDYEDSSISLKESELSVKVAELYFEKAKIARKFQDKTMGVAPKGSTEAVRDDKNKIDVSEYEKYLASQKEKLLNKQQEQQRYADVFKKAEAELKDSGYVQP